MPHLSEEIWKTLKFSDLAINQKWPEIGGLEQESKSKIAVQINGKTRAILEVAVGSNEETVKEVALHNNKIHKYIQNKNIKKVIFVPEKIINIVL